MSVCVRVCAYAYVHVCARANVYSCVYGCELECSRVPFTWIVSEVLTMVVSQSRGL